MIDPVDVKQFCVFLCAGLTKAAKQTLADQYENLINQQKRITGYSCFMVHDHVYFSGQVVHRRSIITGHPPALVKKLFPVFQEWKTVFDSFERDRQKIEQTLNSIFMRAKSWQEIRNMLPDFLVRSLDDLVRDFKNLPRTCVDLASPGREEVWDAKLISMYDHIAPLITLYMGYRLL